MKQKKKCILMKRNFKLILQLQLKHKKLLYDLIVGSSQ